MVIKSRANCDLFIYTAYINLIQDNPFILYLLIRASLDANALSW